MKALAKAMLWNLQNHLAYLKTAPFSASGISPSIKQKVLNEIDELIKKTNKLIWLEHENTTNVHQCARNVFAEMRDMSKRITKHFPPTPTDTAILPGQNANRVSAKSGEFFKVFAEFANELKRHHYTHSSEIFLRDDFEKQNWSSEEGRISGLEMAHKGSEVKRLREVGVTVMVGTDALKQMDIGAAATLKYGDEKRHRIDQDSAFSVQNTYIGSFRLALLGKIGRLVKQGEPDGHVFNTSASLTGARVTGDYIGHKTLKDSYCADVIRDGNAWAFLYQSGNTRSRAARYRQAGQAFVGWVLKNTGGITYVAPHRPPVVNSAKLAKGYNNGPKIAELAALLSESVPGQPAAPDHMSIEKLAKEFYPEVGELLKDEFPTLSKSADVLTTELKPPTKRASFLTNVVALPIKAVGTPMGKGKAITRYSITGKVMASFASLDFVSRNLARFRLGGTASVSVKYSTNVIRFQRPKAVHDALDPGYTHDAEHAKALLDALVAKNCLSAKRISAIRNMLVVPDTGANADPVVKMKARFVKQYEALQLIKDDYLELTNLATRLRSFEDKSYREINSAGHTVLKGDVERFIEKVFPGPGFTAEEDACIKKMKTDPKLFMIKSYDALSTALGAVGLHVSRSKDYMCRDHLEFDDRHGELDIGRKNIQVCYQALKDIMDQVSLPIDQLELLQGQSVVSRCNVDSRHLTITGEFKVGANWVPAGAIPGVKDPTVFGTAAGDTPRLDAIGTSSSAMLGGSYSWENANVREHPNPVRDGLFDTMRYCVRGEGACAAFMEPAIAHGLDQLENRNKLAGKKIANALRTYDAVEPAPPRRANRSANDKTPEPVFLKKTTAEHAGLATAGIQLLSRMALTEHTKEREYYVGYKRPPPIGELVYEKSLQSIRYSVRTNQKTGVVFGGLIPAAVPVTGSLGLSRTTTENDVVYEIIGDCPAFHMLSFLEIQGVLNKSLKKDSDRKTARGGKVSEDCDFTKMRALFNNEKVEGSPPIDGEYLVNKFFGTNESLMAFMNKFIEYQPGRRKFHQGSRLAVRDRERTEFDRLDDKEEYWQTMHSMRRSKDSSAGSKEKPGAIKKTEERDPRPAMTSSEISATKRVSNHLASSDVPMTPKERMTYFMTDPDGMTVFSAYCKIVNGYEEVNTVLKNRNTYEPTVSPNAR